MSAVTLWRDGESIPRPPDVIDPAATRAALLADLDALTAVTAALGFARPTIVLGRLALRMVLASDAELQAEHERISALIVSCVAALPCWGGVC